MTFGRDHGPWAAALELPRWSSAVVRACEPAGVSRLGEMTFGRDHGPGLPHSSSPAGRVPSCERASSA
ncbi:hypothetical protein, partial [Gordonia effusa]|uniref:hypothetical protein n=1 Tax=Gordonia effusa TaxID=263908 RepID=UPI001B8D3BF0